MDALLGIDVGTGSARAGVFDTSGTMLGQASHPIRIWRPRPDHVQQSSEDIWNAVCSAVRGALGQSGPCRVVGIGFDATCSLVVLDGSGAPVSIDVDGAPEQDVIVWMDHRAVQDAMEIDATGHEVLRYVGGRISPEMETPKLRWLQRNLPAAFERAAHFFDLPDYLTWRATCAASRSLCSTVCKWTYLGHEQRWDESYFRQIGLGVLAEEKFSRVGMDIRPMGASVDGGLCEAAAAAFGLPRGTPVGTSAIDAHAGGLGVIGAAIDGTAPDDAALRRRVALVGGTSSCHMAVSVEPTFVPGVWGPYFSAMIPGLWLNEGGQSATGNLIDHIIQTHPAYPALAKDTGRTIYEILNARLGPATSTADLHVLPDFNGNRSPRADARLRGAIVGLTLSATEDDLALLYLATIQAIAYGTRHIIETLNQHGYAIDTIMACGGGTKNPVFLREHANATGCRIILPREPEAILLGAAMLGAVAGGTYRDLRTAMAAMSGAGAVIEPAGGETRAFHDAKYAVFQRLHADQVAYREIMASSTLLFDRDG
jgi:FGGY-family pentulose kinase